MKPMTHIRTIVECLANVLDRLTQNENSFLNAIGEIIAFVLRIAITIPLALVFVFPQAVIRGLLSNQFMKVVAVSLSLIASVALVPCVKAALPALKFDDSLSWLCDKDVGLGALFLLTALANYALLRLIGRVFQVLEVALDEVLDFIVPD